MTENSKIQVNLNSFDWLRLSKDDFIQLYNTCPTDVFYIIFFCQENRVVFQSQDGKDVELYDIGIESNNRILMVRVEDFFNLLKPIIRKHKVQIILEDLENTSSDFI